jgi:predicted transcriptional regulator
MARGRVIADARRSLDLSCTEAAANWGVTRRELQDAELGTTDPMTWPAKLAAFRAASAPKKEETRG